jgi:hypothetical protein
MSAVTLSHSFRAPFPFPRAVQITNLPKLIIRKQRERSDRPTSTNTIDQCMSMNHDDGDRQTATESEPTMWRLTQSKACMISVTGNVNLGKDGTQRIHGYIAKLHHKASVETSFSVFRSVALTALMSEWRSSPYSDRESSVSYNDVISCRIP